jgi:hypothetical protein
LFQPIVVSGRKNPIASGKRTDVFFVCFSHWRTNLSGLRDLCAVTMKFENFGLQFDNTTGWTYLQDQSLGGGFLEHKIYTSVDVATNSFSWWSEAIETQAHIF